MFRWLNRAIQIPHLDASDVLVLRTKRRLSAEQAHALRTGFERALLRAETRTIVIGDDMEVAAVVRRPGQF